MAVLGNARHEHFAQLVAKGASARKAYIGAGYSESGAAQSAARLLTNAEVCERVEELKKAISSGLTEASIRDVNARVAHYQRRWERLSAAIDKLMDERGAAMAGDPDIPGGQTGLVTRDYKGLQAGKVISRVDPGLIALLAEERENLQQASRELGQWMDKSEVTTKTGDLAARLAKGRERVAKARKK